MCKLVPNEGSLYQVNFTTSNRQKKSFKTVLDTSNLVEQTLKKVEFEKVYCITAILQASKKCWSHFGKGVNVQNVSATVW